MSIAKRVARHVPAIRRLQDSRSEAASARDDAIREQEALLERNAELEQELADAELDRKSLEARNNDLAAWNEVLRAEEARNPQRATSSVVRLQYAIPIGRRASFPATVSGRRLHDGMRADESRYVETLRSFRDLLADLGPIPAAAHPSELRMPHWDNGFMPPLDAISIAGYLARLRPTRYLEVGSGNSTKFARHTITRLGLPTQIVSIDPNPRAEVDALCDRVVRAGLQHDDAVAEFHELQPGDLVFFDGSHYVFPGSDATVFFTELLGVLPANCTFGVHDIWLPDDYPDLLASHSYNEQYLLVAWLLGGASGAEICFPAWYIARNPELAPVLDDTLAAIGVPAGSERHGCSFWMQTPVASAT